MKKLIALLSRIFDLSPVQRTVPFFMKEGVAGKARRGNCEKIFFHGWRGLLSVFACLFLFSAPSMAGNVPNGYTELEYIESTGTQYIDTGVVPTDAMGFSIVLQSDSVTQDNVAIGSRENTGDTRFWIDVDFSGGKNGLVLFGWNNFHSVNRVIGTNKKTISMNFQNSRRCVIDGDIVDSISETLATQTKPMYLFSANGASQTYNFKGKIYSVVISEGANIIANFIPAKDSRGTVGMYDTVSGQFFTNAGTGTFTAGPELDPCRNLFDEVAIDANWVTGKIKNDSGTEINDNTSTYSSYFIPVKPSTTYYISGSSEISIRNPIQRIYYYTSSKTWISRTTPETVYKTPFTTPSDCYFIQVQKYNTSYATTTNIQLEQGSSATAYTPYDSSCQTVQNSGPISSVTVSGLVAQNGTPTPATPVAIKTNNGTLKVSKNLFDKTNGEYINGYVTVGTGTISSPTDSFGQRSFVIPCRPNTTYTLSGMTAASGWGSFTAKEIGSTATNYRSGNGTITTGANDIYLIGLAYTTNGAYDYRNTLQLEQGSTATAYHPYGEVYVEGTQETITDSANHTANVATLLGVGDYHDTQNINTGAITRKVGVKVLDGTEEWAKISSVQGRYRYRLTIDDMVSPTGGANKIICNSFRSDYSIEELNDNDVDNAITTFFSSGQRIYVYTSLFSTDTEFKTWLAEQYANGTPVTIVYPLATATTESVAGQTMTMAPVSNKTGGVTGMTITTLLSDGRSIVTTIADAIKIATTKYNNTAFSGVVTALNNAVDTIKTVVSNTINQATAVANLHSGKQTKPTDTCPNGKICLLVEDEAGTPHWYEIIERAPGIVPAGSGYTQVEYLQMPAGSYINTNVVPTYNGHYEMDFQTTSLTGTGAFLGGRTAAYPAGLIFGWNSDKTINFDGFSATRYTSTNTLTNDTRYTYIWNNKVATLKQGDTVVGTNTFTGTDANGAALYINGFNYNNVVNGSSTGIYFYSFQAWNASGTMVGDFVPARRDSDGVLGMYDTVSGNFFTNAGTGEFYAPDQYIPSTYTRLEYIQSTGTQYIDTGIKDIVNLKTEIVAQQTRILDGYRVLVGAIDDGSNYKVVLAYGSGGHFYSQPNNNSYNLSVENQDTNKHTFVVDLKTNTNDLTIDGGTPVHQDYSINTTQTNSLFLFARNKGTEVISQTEMKLWSAKFYRSGTLIADYIPARRESDGVLGMYDLMDTNPSTAFHTNKGTGSFTAGPVAQ